MPKKNRLVLLIPAVLSLLLVLGVTTVFSACPRKADGTWMHCHSCQNAPFFVLFFNSTTIIIPIERAEPTPIKIPVFLFILFVFFMFTSNVYIHSYIFFS